MVQFRRRGLFSVCGCGALMTLGCRSTTGPSSTGAAYILTITSSPSCASESQGWVSGTYTFHTATPQRIENGVMRYLVITDSTWTRLSESPMAAGALDLALDLAFTPQSVSGKLSGLITKPGGPASRFEGTVMGANAVPLHGTFSGYIMTYVRFIFGIGGGCTHSDHTWTLSNEG